MDFNGKKVAVARFSRPGMNWVSGSIVPLKVGNTAKLADVIAEETGVSSDMILSEVLDTGYTVKNSMLNEKLEKLTPEDRDRIYEVLDTLIKQSKQILP